MEKLQFTLTNRISVLERLGGFDWTALGVLLSTWTPGTKGYITAHKVGKPKSPEQLGWYYAVILPEAVKAFAVNKDFSLTLELGDKRVEVELTLDNMDNFLKLRYAAMTGEYVNKADMTMAACAAFEDWAISWLATWLKIQIPPPDPDWRQKNEA